MDSEAEVRSQTGMYKRFTLGIACLSVTAHPFARCRRTLSPIPSLPSLEANGMGEEEVTANNCNNVLAHKRKRGEDMLLQAVTLFPMGSVFTTSR